MDTLIKSPGSRNPLAGLRPLRGSTSDPEPGGGAAKMKLDQPSSSWTSSSSLPPPPSFFDRLPHSFEYFDDQTNVSQDDPGSRGPTDESLALILPLLILLSTLLFLLLIFLLFLIVLRRRRGIVLRDDDGPLDIGREEDDEGEGGLIGVEARWLETVDENTRKGYRRAKAYQAQYPPNSLPTDITLSQFLSIQEKGVSAWCFEPDYELNPAIFVEARTEITFLADGIGMAPEEGGGCCVQSNLPLPRLNEVYYWEVKMFEKPEGTTVAVGLATKPFPSFRLPGWNKFSVGYFSQDGFKSYNHPFHSQSYGPPLLSGDVLGVGYRPRTGAIFFTRNGKKLEDAYIGMNKYNLFPTIGSNGAATVHVNLGQAGFVFIEANVKKWGLAPMMGTLAPPPAYGSERGSILLEAAGMGPAATGTATNFHSNIERVHPPPPSSSGLDPRVEAARLMGGMDQSDGGNNAGGSGSGSGRRRSSKRHRHRRPDPSSASEGGGGGSGGSRPGRPSPLRSSTSANEGSGGTGGRSGSGRRTSSRRTVSTTAHSPSGNVFFVGGVGGRRGSEMELEEESRGTVGGDVDEGEGEGEGEEEEEESMLTNPPTPNTVDISLHSLSPISSRGDEGDSLVGGGGRGGRRGGGGSEDHDHERDHDHEQERGGSPEGADADETRSIETGSSGTGSSPRSLSPTRRLSPAPHADVQLPTAGPGPSTAAHLASGSAGAVPGIGCGAPSGAYQATFWNMDPHTKPPDYHVVDPNKYPPGVWEAMLEEQFAQAAAQSSSSSSAIPRSIRNRERERLQSSSGGTPGSYEARGSTPHPDNVSSTTTTSGSARSGSGSGTTSTVSSGNGGNASGPGSVGGSPAAAAADYALVSALRGLFPSSSRRPSIRFPLLGTGSGSGSGPGARGTEGDEADTTRARARQGSSGNAGGGTSRTRSQSRSRQL